MKCLNIYCRELGTEHHNIRATNSSSSVSTGGCGMELNFGPFNAPSAENSPLDLPFTPKRIKVKVQQQEQAGTATHTLNNSSGSASRSEHPCSPPEVGNSACSDTSTDCWITAVIPHHHDYANRPTSTKPDASSECTMAAAGTGTLCSEPTGHVQSPMQVRLSAMLSMLMPSYLHTTRNQTGTRRMACTGISNASI